MIDTAPVWTEIQELVAATWPDVDDGYRGTMAPRINWRDALVAGELVPPFTIIRGKTLEPYEELSVDAHHFALGLEIYYVRNSVQTSAEVAAGARAEQDCETRCIELGNAFYDGEHSTFMVLEEFVVDASDENEVNMFLSGVNPALIAGCVRGQVIVSEY